MKKKSLNVLFAMNIGMFLYLLCPFILSIFSRHGLNYWVTTLIFDGNYRIILGVFQIAAGILWISNFIFIIKYKPKVKDIILILAISWIYSPIYYFNNRLKKQEKIGKSN